MPADLSRYPEFDQAYVISDLHLGGGDFSVQMFAAAPQFKTFIQHVLKSFKTLQKVKPDARVLLVINGDFVDFLAEPGATEFNLERAATMLGELFDRYPFNNVLANLQDYVATEGTHLVITLGNHDLELALPDSSRELKLRLTNRQQDLEGKIEFRFDGWGYRFRIGARLALCLHGNESDTYNFTRYDELDRVIQDLHHFGQSNFGLSWQPSAGSWFVIHAVNPVKRLFPFVDLLKPEKSVMPTVLSILDPSKVKYVEELARMGAKAAANDFSRPDSQRRFLSTNNAFIDRPVTKNGPSRESSAKKIMDDAEWAIANDRIEELIRRPVDTEMLNWFGDAARWIRDQAYTVTDTVRSTISRSVQELQLKGMRTLLPAMLNDDPYDIEALSDDDRAINAGVRADYDVVFAGHTHMKRMAVRPDQSGLYVNTGTWAGLMGFRKSDVSSPEFEKTFQALRAGDRESLFQAKLVRQECTFARITTEKNGTVTVALGQVSIALGVEYSDSQTRPLGPKDGK